MSAADSTPKPQRRATAESMAQKQREISVSEFFTKNRHLLGFDNPAKALLTTVKEAVDNSLDACEEAGILPTLHVDIAEISENRYRIGAAGLYAMLTTGKPVVILSKTGKGRPARKVELRIDTRKNQPDVLKEDQIEWDVDH